MKKLLFVTVFCIALLAFAFPADATMITFSPDHTLAVADDTLTTPVSSSFAIVETFNNWAGVGTNGLDQSWAYSGPSWMIKEGSSSLGAAPYNGYPIGSPEGADTTYYLSVMSKSLTIDFGGTYNYLGFFWGSIDKGGLGGILNTIEFLKNGAVVETWDGLDIKNEINVKLGLDGTEGGSWTKLSDNQYVNFWNVPDFDAVYLITNAPAFELDNLTVSVVPLPATILLGLLGLGVGGWKLRKS